VTGGPILPRGITSPAAAAAGRVDEGRQSGSMISETIHVFVMSTEVALSIRPSVGPWVR